MDRVYVAIVVSALLLMLGATGLYVTRTADLMPHARSRRQMIDQREALVEGLMDDTKQKEARRRTDHGLCRCGGRRAS